jgi:membrane-anchored mycosin MYCP
MTVENLRQGLDAVIAAVPTMGIRIVNMSLAIPDDDEIRARIARLTALGVVVVAPTGNRSSELPSDMPSSFQTPSPGEDAAPYVHPADYEGVLGVSVTPGGSTSDDPTHWVLENSMTDVAAPSAGAVSYSLRGESCVLTDPATSYAAAEVSGVLALLQSAHDEPVAVSVRRLLTTANGRPDIPNTLVGAGEVQAMDALTRPMVVDDDGTDLSGGSVEHQPQVLRVPPEPEDVLASTRHDAVWWGLAGGGVLLLAVVLRPVLARRRRTVRP